MLPWDTFHRRFRGRKVKRYGSEASFEEKTEGIGDGIGMAGLRAWALARLGIGRNGGEVPRGEENLNTRKLPNQINNRNKPLI